MKISERLRAAKRLIETEGWFSVKGFSCPVFYDPPGVREPYCALTAIAAIATTNDGENCDYKLYVTPVVRAMGFDSGQELADWNNMAERTKQEVLDRFEEAAIGFENMGN